MGLMTSALGSAQEVIEGFVSTTGQLSSAAAAVITVARNPKRQISAERIMQLITTRKTPFAVIFQKIENGLPAASRLCAGAERFFGVGSTKR